jgi:hypothetical protein
MARQFDQPPARERPRKRARNLPGCIKYILLLLLVLLLVGEIASGELRRLGDGNPWIWLVLLLKLVLIAGLIALIRVQRALRCELLEPTGCAIPEYDPVLDKLVIRVVGTAAGEVFGHYTLVANPPLTVIYPGGGASGTAPVVNGELGKLDVTGMEPAAYDLTLTVHPIGAGSPCTHTSHFEWQRKPVWIDKVGQVQARVMGPHPGDPTEVLKLVKVNPDPPSPAPPGPEASVGGAISVVGSADFYGCGRQMVEYALHYRSIAAGSDPWQADAPGAWSDINGPLPFGTPAFPRWYTFLSISLPNFVLNGRLTRQWITDSVLATLFPTTYHTVQRTDELPWSTGTNNGRFTVRLRVKHDVLIGPPTPTPPELYDAATVWLDNRDIDGRITGMAIAGGGALGACDELLLSQFVTPGGTKVNAEIDGRAWDPLILDSYPGTLKPNDNFGSYRLLFKKDGGGWNPLATSITRVPNVLQATPLPPLPAGTDTLASWDIVGALDAGPAPSPPGDPSPKLYRGDRCAYLIELYVHDTTHLGDSATPHQAWDYWPFCIMNDLPGDLVFPVP